MNTITMICRLTHEPHLAYDRDHRPVARLHVSDMLDGSAFVVEASGELAERSCESYHRGDDIIVFGSVRADRSGRATIVAQDVAASTRQTNVTIERTDHPAEHTHGVPPSAVAPQTYSVDTQEF